MREESLITTKCPECGKTGVDTLEHAKATWEETYKCEGCGTMLKQSREDLLAAAEAPDQEGFVIAMQVVE